MKQKESYVLERHKHKITQISTTGRWKTYYKDRNGKLKAIEKVNRDDLIKELYKLYSNTGEKTFADIFDEILRHKVTSGRILKDTADNYRSTFHKYLSPFIFNPISKFDEDSLQEAIGQVAISKRPPEKRMKECVEHIHEVYRWALRHGLVTRDASYGLSAKDFYRYCDCKKKLADEKIFNKEEIELIRIDMEKNFANPRAQIILLSIETGMRVGELCALHSEDVSEKFIHVHRQQRRYIHPERYEEIPYTKDERTHPHGGRLFPVTCSIEKLLTRIPKGKVYLFEENREWIKKFTVIRFLNRHCKALGLHITNNHAFRMSLNSNFFYEAGLNAKQRSYLLGHSVDTNERYYTYTREAEIEKLRDSLNFAKKLDDETPSLCCK